MGLAASPLYELTGKYAAFFVAHEAKPVDIYFLVFLLSFLLPALLAIPLFLLGRLSQRLRDRYHYIVLFILLFLIVLPVFIKLFVSINLAVDSIIILSTLFFIFFITFAYICSAQFRLLFTLASPAIIAVPIIFLFFSPVRSVISVVSGGNATGEVEIEGETPVVMVVFDEFPVTSLMDGDYNIDSKLFPNFAALAKDSHWFRNATTVSANTDYALPSILTGNFPDGAEHVPTLTDYPGNLFTFLSPSYRINAFECCTQLVPPGLRKGSLPGFIERISSLFSDIYILYLHVITPPKRAASLPEIGLGWEDFASTGSGDGEKEEGSKGRRKERFEEFIGSIDPIQGPSFNFLHLLLPHSPWTFYPSGSTFVSFGSGSRGISGLDEYWWSADEWHAVQGYQRHMLQIGFADRMLGELVARLKESGIYERAIIVVLADHGISFSAEDHMRSITNTNYPSIISVPLFFKEPYQKSGTVNDSNVETIDIVPTIAGVLGALLPWKADGSSMLKAERTERGKKTAYNGAWGREGEERKRYDFDAKIDEKYKMVDKKNEIFAGGLFSIGPYRELAGRQVKELWTGERSELQVMSNIRELESAAKREGVKVIRGQVTGEIRGTHLSSKPVHLALAVDKKIVTLTRSVDFQDGKASFSALLPETTYSQARANIEIFEIIGSPDDPALKATGSVGYRLIEATGGTKAISLIDENGLEISSLPIEHSALLGRMDRITIEAKGQITFGGWAADTINGERVREVLAFNDGRFILSAKTSLVNREEERLRGAPEKSRFIFTVPSKDAARDLVNIRIFVVSKNGKASELNYPFGVKGAPEMSIEEGAGGDVLRLSASELIPVKPGALRGELQSARKIGDDTVLSGWAYDTQRLTHPDWILFFSDSKLIHMARTSYYLPGLVKDVGADGVLKSGFIFKVPGRIAFDPSMFRLYALSKDLVATELAYFEGFEGGGKR